MRIYNGLVPCKICGSPGIEQVRGLLGPDDKGYVEPCEVIPNVRQDTSNVPANAPDTRVTCSNMEFVMRDAEKVWKCNNATGWNKPDFADYTRFVWNRDNANEPETAAARN
jgi:hypothetical protein